MRAGSYPYPPRRTVVARETPSRRSHAAIPVAIGVGLAGLYLGTISVLVPAMLGIVLLVSGTSFLSARINPLSTKFYLGIKPSWAAVGVVFLIGTLLLGIAYAYFVLQFGPLIP